MSEGAMSHGVSKLKELLFDSEERRLADLSRRLDQLGDQLQETRATIIERKAYEEGARAELSRRIDTVFDRAGSEERFQRSVADVIDGAITRAEGERHEALASALAPVTVGTVKREILNSRDELVEALYPMTGQMVKAYVASAMRDLVNEVNRRLESNPLMLRFKSLTTGRSMAELALAESQRLQVKELLLIRRGTGELMARWPDKPGASNHDHVLGGVLTAINSFATEALQSEENALRQIDLGETQVYLRGSPGHLLAARCSGTAGASIEQIIDDEFLSTVSILHGAADAGAQARSGLATLGQRLNRRVTEQYEVLDAPALGISPAKLVAAMILVPLLVWFAWSTWVGFETNRVRETARHILETSAEIQGYPTTISVAPRGRAMTITGLAPSEAALQTVLDRLTAGLPGTSIDNHMSVVPQGARDATADIKALRLELDTLGQKLGSLDGRLGAFSGRLGTFADRLGGVDDKLAGLDRRLGTVGQQLGSLDSQLGTLDRDVWRRAGLRSLDNARRGLDAARTQLDRLAGLGRALKDPSGERIATAAAGLNAPLDAATASARSAETALAASTQDKTAADGIAGDLPGRVATLQAAVAELERAGDMILASDTRSGDTAASVPAGEPPYVTAADRLDGLAARLQLVTVALIQREQMRAAIPKPTPGPLDRLIAFTRTNAVFFTDSIDYRDPVIADAQLDQLAGLMREAGVLVRIVGYTDERGTVTRNTSLSQRRADKVRDALIARGVPAAKLVAIGRLSMIDISPETGPTSPNRRVEFEIGFKGEAGP